MNRLTKEQRDQILLVIIGTLGLCVIVWYLLASPQSARLAQGQTRVREAKDKVAKATELVRQKDAIEKTLEQNLQQINRIEEDMASGDLYAWAILTLNKFLEGHKIKITNISRETITPVGLLPSFPYQSAMYTLVGTAFFHDFGSFVAAFENQYPYFRLQNLELGLTAERELLTFRVEIVALLSNQTTP